jgi:hypothetical protein
VIAAALIVVRMINPPGDGAVGLQIGAWLGLASAIAIAIGSWLGMQEPRSLGHASAA